MEKERVIVLDTETTGFSFHNDRITEVGCLEVVDFKPTGKYFHCYHYSGMEIPKRVIELTGITNEFLEDKPTFKDKAQDLLDFIGDSMIVAHNANFDCSMIDAELARAGYPRLTMDRYIDTLKKAREVFPGKRNTLDALCDRFKVSRKIRDKHGAIVDAYLLYFVYKELYQQKIDLFSDLPEVKEDKNKIKHYANNFSRVRPIKFKSLITEEEILAHYKFIKEIEKETGEKMLWTKYEEKKSI